MLQPTNWTDHTWVIREADSPVILKDASSEFTFKAHLDSEKNVAYYTVVANDIPGAAMTEYWKPCKFFPRGLSVAKVWTEPKPLPKKRQQWPNWPARNPALTAIGKTLDFNSRRLEGDFKVGDEIHAVTIWMVEQAIQGENGAEPLLVIDVRDRHQAQTNESGSGTGDPR